MDKTREILAPVIKPGDIVIDATVGNGYDTLFLANAVGSTGQVLGFDVQPQALENTRLMLEQHNVRQRVTLFLHNHADLADCIPPAGKRRIRSVMFNLGYLPRGNKSVITQASSTLTALDAVLPHLRPGGVISIVAYRGHPGGEQETEAVAAWSSRLAAADYGVDHFTPRNASGKAPLLIIIRRNSANP